MNFKCFLIVCVITMYSCTEGPFDWTDPVSGTKYDYSALKRDPK